MTVLLSAAAGRKDDFGSLSAVLPALGWSREFTFSCKGSTPRPWGIGAVAVGQMIISQVLTPPALGCLCPTTCLESCWDSVKMKG